MKHDQNQSPRDESREQDGKLQPQNNPVPTNRAGTQDRPADECADKPRK